MTERPRQMPIPLPVQSVMDADTLAVSPANRAAMTLIESWPDWSAPHALIAGPTGSGKTHLGMIWKQRASAVQLDADQLSKAVADTAHSFFIDDLRPSQIDETGLFHILNLARQRGGHVLMTSRDWPSAWGIATPDLLSRLRAATTVEIGEPDDTLLRAALVKLFADRQLVIDSDVIEFLVLRMERSLGAACAVVDALDREALVRQSRITKPLAREILAEFEVQSTRTNHF